MISFLLLPLICVSFTIGRNQPGANQKVTVEDQAFDVSNVKFLLWTRHNPTSAEEVSPTAESILTSHFSPSHPTVVLAHGFSSHGLEFATPFASAFLSVGEYNVFSIEWSHLASWENYFAAAANTRVVGEHAATLVQAIQDVGAGHIHLVGHSLGAHVVGFLGKKVQELGLGKLPRITGLDPAQPAFDLAGPGGRLDHGDAEFVDVIHTNSGMLWNGCLSILKPIGHVDYYPNGGSHQPGCTDICLDGETCTENNINDLIKGGCSHSRAKEYFIESIEAGPWGNDQFLAWWDVSWDSFVAGGMCASEQDFSIMGAGDNTGAPWGSYYLRVGEEAPFAMDMGGDFCNGKI